MTPDEASAAFSRLSISPFRAAGEFGVSTRTVYRWLSVGCSGPAEVALVLSVRLHELGVPWRMNEVAISLGGLGGIRFLTDGEAVILRSIEDLQTNEGRS